LVVDLVDAVLLDVGAVDGLGVVVGHVGCFAGLGDGVVVMVNEPHELFALLVSDLDVLSDHG